MAKNKGYVISYEIGGKSDNLVNLIAFGEKVKTGEHAKVNVVDFLGKRPIINQVVYNGKVFKVTNKNNPNDKGRTQTCKSFIDQQMGIFLLNDCESHKGVGLIATSPYYYKEAVAKYKEQQIE